MSVLVKRLLREYIGADYAVIEITKPLAYMSPEMYYQATPLQHTQGEKIYVNKGSAGGVSISTKHIKVLKVFNQNQKEEMNDFLTKLRDSNK